MIKEYIDKNTTILKALDTLQCVLRTNASEDTDLMYQLIYKDDDGEFPIHYIDIKFDYFDDEGDNEELTKHFKT